MSDISDDDLIGIGTALLNAVTLVGQLGHASPASLLDYIHGDAPAVLIVKDFIAWTSNQQGKLPDCEERLINLVKRSGWEADLIARIDRYLP